MCASRQSVGQALRFSGATDGMLETMVCLLSRCSNRDNYADFSARAGRALALVVPAAAVWQLIAEVLAEEARDMRALRRERVVHRAWDQHLHDRLARPALLARGRVCAIHVSKRGREDDSRAVVRLRRL